MQAPESLELFDRACHAGIRQAHVDLYHFIAGARTGIRDVDGQRDLFPRSNGAACDPQIVDQKGSIAEAMAERVERLIAHLHIRRFPLAPSP